MPKLTIELVPSSSWFSNVRDHVTKPQWDAIRKRVYKAADYKCQICGDKGDIWPVECHEIWEYRSIKGYTDRSTGEIVPWRNIQKLMGMIALCPSCHQVKHIGFASVTGNSERALDHLKKINGWSDETARGYINNAFEEWRRRSRYKWTLDLSWLKDNYDITFD